MSLSHLKAGSVLVLVCGGRPGTVIWCSKLVPQSRMAFCMRLHGHLPAIIHSSGSCSTAPPAACFSRPLPMPQVSDRASSAHLGMSAIQGRRQTLFHAGGPKALHPEPESRAVKACVCAGSMSRRLHPKPEVINPEPQCRQLSRKQGSRAGPVGFQRFANGILGRATEVFGESMSCSWDDITDTPCCGEAPRQ